MQWLADFILMMIELAVPLVLAAEAAMIAERTGVICLGVEGMMLFGAFFGAFGSEVFQSGWMGLIVAVISGILVGLLYGVFAVNLKGQQVVVGVAINFLAAGITPILTSMVWENEGAGDTVQTIKSWNFLAPFGGTLFLSPLIPITVCIVIGLAIFLYCTKFGLRLRMTGDYPLGVQTCGINTNKYKLCAMLASGALAAAGGAYLSIAYGDVFVTDMVAGRGYMGVVANIFGGWNPVLGAIAAVFFAGVQALRYTLIDVKIPTQFMQMLPYVVTLLALVIFGKKSKSPQGLGRL